MKRLLFVHCSPHGEAALGHGLASDILKHLLGCDAACTLRERDLTREPLPPITPGYASAIATETAPDSAAFELSEGLIEELEDSDLLLLAAPVHNFTVPAALKLWIDHVVRINRSFAVADGAKVGLLQDRPTYVLVSAGGFYQGERASQADFFTPYLREVLNTIGIFTIRFVHLQGLSMGADARATALSEARRALAQDPLIALP